MEPKLIKRGERVNIRTSNQNLVISMAGIAMMDGIKGQNIRIKNIKSKQIVHATVEKPGQVVVTF
jgi:flagella basal body P-ring formation protein FlgA